MILLCMVLLALTGGVAAGEETQTEQSPPSDLVSEQYYTEAQARDLVYGPGGVWRDTVCQVDSSVRQELFGDTGLQERDSVIRLSYTLDSAGSPLGVYRVASELGKYLPFEFLVALDAHGRVEDVVVMNYRESRGGEVRRMRFLEQYRGKSVTSPVRLNRDILGIAGATLSAWAVNRGVKKTLWWSDRLWPRGVRP